MSFIVCNHTMKSFFFSICYLIFCKVYPPRLFVVINSVVQSVDKMVILVNVHVQCLACVFSIYSNWWIRDEKQEAYTPIFEKDDKNLVSYLKEKGILVSCPLLFLLWFYVEKYKCYPLKCKSCKDLN